MVHRFEEEHSIMNEMIHEILNGDFSLPVNAVMALDNLIDYVEKHFRTEEITAFECGMSFDERFKMHQDHGRLHKHLIVLNREFVEFPYDEERFKSVVTDIACLLNRHQRQDEIMFDSYKG